MTARPGQYAACNDCPVMGAAAPLSIIMRHYIFPWQQWASYLGSAATTAGMECSVALLGATPKRCSLCLAVISTVHPAIRVSRAAAACATRTRSAVLTHNERRRALPGLTKTPEPRGAYLGMEGQIARAGPSIEDVYEGEAEEVDAKTGPEDIKSSRGMRSGATLYLHYMQEIQNGTWH
ncbi:hypothetical protein BU16DRAFT_567209 [Lophium mytilinum]|uniref:Uncharacterized protein n=1 Tax=Lophium mytilinum TaxID=390894 RepID=A0A6A6QDI7_9PEZI|nr:hypothetical protein BU16DRAFT_567209 [Lophium mytilinum]